MKTLIVCTSVSHGNTDKVAEVMAGALDATLIRPEQAGTVRLADYDLVGFGSGIFNMDFHPSLREYIKSIHAGRDARCFVFYTSGLPEPVFRRYSRGLTAELAGKGFDVVGVFSCRAFDTWLPFRMFGGIRKGRPDRADLDGARVFAEALTRGRRFYC